MLIEERTSALASLLECQTDVAARLAAAMSDERIDRQRIIAHQGDVCDGCWIVVDGSVQIRLIGIEGQINLLNTYGPGEMFGAYPAPVVHRAEVYAYSKLHMLHISSATLWRLAQEHSGIGSGISKLLAKQLDGVLDRLAERITLTATGRIHAELLRLANDDDVIAQMPLVAGLALSVQTTRETASRALNALERRGVIRRDGRRIEIVSRRMLEDLVV
ncbi:MAG: Crp/Fnr family transcriptional regulator [Parasphingorhabdus sp.]|nr:Crp/Fnr family transcriptional regulator [Parasphingorhabdus sp.]